MKEQIEKLEAFVKEARANFEETEKPKGNKSAAVRLRKNMQDVKSVAQEIRVAALERTK